MAKSPRAPIRAATKHQLNAQFDTACGICRSGTSSQLVIHHIDNDIQNPTLQNLLLLCENCHADFTRGLKSEADAKMFKRMAETGYLQPRKPLTSPKTGSADVINHGTNSGVIGQTIHIGSIQVPRDRRGNSSRELPGTIGADPDMRTYANYLAGKYIECQKNSAGWGRRKGPPFKPGATHGILGEGFGVTNSLLQIPQSRFFEWVASAQNKIRRTVFAKSLKHDFFHSWEDHLRQRRAAED